MNSRTKKTAKRSRRKINRKPKTKRRASRKKTTRMKTTSSSSIRAKRKRARKASPTPDFKYICASYGVGPDACFPKTTEGVKAMFAEGYKRNGDSPHVMWPQMEPSPNYLGKW